MRLELESRLGCVVLVALGACTTDVEIFRSPEGRAAVAAAAGTASSSNVLITRGSASATPDVNCRAGHYVGDFNGTYNSAALPNGTGPLMIAATPSLGKPGLEFWLERIPRNCRTDEEFCADFTVRGGKIRGFANPFPSANAPPGGTTDNGLAIAIRFEIDLSGELDCSSGVFRGLLQNGCYDLATLLFRFEGTAPAFYDPASSSFNDGMWSVEEKPTADRWVPPDAELGGMGSWQARFANDMADPAADSVSFCDM
ncbi:MAG TPA: hypothetical protein VFN67_37100 [Polyangiales bacterium]|nr:hypothetical protein [Polyangiales bacterium]